jgi:hypothetical protein
MLGAQLVVGNMLCKALTSKSAVLNLGEITYERFATFDEDQAAQLAHLYLTFPASDSRRFCK